ncbi:hypothetical protein GA0111570_106174 [Raineyella antarctica]|uniref:Uncharacterized protein n=1 Tax=Raineyella antarctica TaxID=1577474 RepID=A0A1G6H453_9ACTN|nr:hypothetical protein [Raineyella antarctica]SDB89059.1 hypothetical protein GA0111570_106174 [Raineyella antarctica]
MPDVLTEVRKRRGPFTRIVIGLVVAWLVLGAVRIGFAIQGGLGPLEAAGRHAQDFVSVPVLLVLLLFVVADVWVRPRLENAPALAVAATWAASVAVAVSIGVGIAGLWAPQLRGPDRAIEVADIIVSSVVPVLLCVALGTVTGAARRASAQAGRAVESSADAPAVTAGAEAEQASAAGSAGAAVDGSAPTWAPDEASGAAWTTAADAARGSGAAWGDDSTPFGWEPSTSRPGLEQGPAGPPAAGSAPAGGPTGPTTPNRPSAAPGQLDRGLWEGSGRDKD